MTSSIPATGKRVSSALRWRLDESFTLDYAYDRSNVREAPPIAQLHTDASGYLGSYVTSEREDELALSYSLPSETPAPLGGSGEAKPTSSRLGIR